MAFEDLRAYRPPRRQTERLRPRTVVRMQNLPPAHRDDLTDELVDAGSDFSVVTTEIVTRITTAAEELRARLVLARGAVPNDSTGGGPLVGSPSPKGSGGRGLTLQAARARDLVSSTFGVTDIGGYSDRNVAGTSKLSDHARGLAIDVMVYKDRALGDRVASWAVANAGPLWIKYIIWYDRIWRPGRSWGSYTHPSRSSNPTLQHRDHVHLSFLE